jgi:hypothetical protein
MMGRRVKEGVGFGSGSVFGIVWSDEGARLRERRLLAGGTMINIGEKHV